MVKYFCDRCKKELDESARKNAKDIKVNNFTEMSLVCEDCYQSLKSWMSLPTKKHICYCSLCEADIREETAQPVPREDLRRYRGSLSPDDHPWT